MGSEYSQTISLSFSKNGISENIGIAAPPINVLGKYIIKSSETTGTSDESIPLGDIGTIGRCYFHNLFNGISTTPPIILAISTVGTPATTTWGYKIVAQFTDSSHSAASDEFDINTGAATINSTDYNALTWTAADGTSSYDIYRVVHGTSPTTLGKIGNQTVVPGDTYIFNDTGLAGDGTTAPSTPTVNLLQIGSDGTLYPISLKPLEEAVVRWNAAAIHAKSSLASTLWEYLLIED